MFILLYMLKLPRSDQDKKERPDSKGRCVMLLQEVPGGGVSVHSLDSSQLFHQLTEDSWSDLRGL